MQSLAGLGIEFDIAPTARERRERFAVNVHRRFAFRQDARQIVRGLLVEGAGWLLPGSGAGRRSSLGEVLFAVGQQREVEVIERVRTWGVAHASIPGVTIEIPERFKRHERASFVCLVMDYGSRRCSRRRRSTLNPVWTLPVAGWPASAHAVVPSRDPV